MNEYRQFFNFTFNDIDLQNQFLREIQKFGKPVFSNAEVSGIIFKVSKSAVAKIVRPSGEYRRLLKEISNIDAMSEGYKSAYGSTHFAKSMLTILKDSKSKSFNGGSLTMLMNRLKKFRNDFNDANGQFNVVWYDKYRPLVIK